MTDPTAARPRPAAPATPDDLPADQQRLTRAFPWLVARGLTNIQAKPLGGLSNDNWRLDTPAGAFVLRVPRPDPAGYILDRADEIRVTAAAAKAGFAPALHASDAENGLILSRFVDDAAAATRADVVRVGKALGKLHRSKLPIERRFDPFALIRDYRARLGSRDPLTPQLKAALFRAEQLADHVKTVPSHGDPVPENLLVSPAGVVFIDWEYAALASPTWDLAYFILHAGLAVSEEAALIKAYGSKSFYASQMRAAKLAVALVGALWSMVREDGEPNAYAATCLGWAEAIAEGWVG
ncbi:MAG: phosphotransferase [Hyphomicrobiaceae bacterium]|nr:phosphotransferase [Hyphomicrobiaceae bacterium]